MVLVEVINIPIRYNEVTYRRGEQFEIEPIHVIPSVMKIVGEVCKDQSDIFIGEPIVLSGNALKEMSIDGLKDYAKEFNINLGRSSSREGIIEKIAKAQSKEG